MTELPPIDAQPADWLVFADDLQRKGDPRGELIVLNHALASGQTTDATTRDQYVIKHAETLLGDAAPLASRLEIGWKGLYVDTLKIGIVEQGQVAIIPKVLRSELVAGLTELTLSADVASAANPIDMSDAVGALVDAGLPRHCRSLSLVDARAERSSSVIARDYSPPDNLVSFGPLGRLWPRLESLESFRLSVAAGEQVEFGDIVLPSLRAFAVDCLTWSGYGNIDGAFAAAKWPKLQSFSIRLPETWTLSVADDPGGYTRPYEDFDYYDDYGYEDEDDGYHDTFNWREDLEPLLASFDALPLETLKLTDFESGENVLGAIEGAGLPATLRTLDLSNATLPGPGWFLENRTMIERLDRLVLQGSNLSGRDVEQLRALDVELDYTAGSGPVHRFLVGME